MMRKFLYHIGRVDERAVTLFEPQRLDWINCGKSRTAGDHAEGVANLLQHSLWYGAHPAEVPRNCGSAKSALEYPYTNHRSCFSPCLRASVVNSGSKKP